MSEKVIVNSEKLRVLFYDTHFSLLFIHFSLRRRFCSVFSLKKESFKELTVILNVHEFIFQAIKSEIINPKSKIKLVVAAKTQHGSHTWRIYNRNKIRTHCTTFSFFGFFPH